MFTVVPGWSDWNFWFTDATRSGQPDWASVCSHTVMLEAVAFFVAPDVVAATAAATTATSKRATILRLFIWKPPESGGPFPDNETRRRSVGTDHLPSSRMLSQLSPKSQYQFQKWSSPLTAAGCRA